MNAQDFSAAWAKVEEYKKDGKPKSAIEKADSIYKAAKGTNNFQHMLKAMVTIIENKSNIDADAFIKDVKDFEDLCRELDKKCAEQIAGTPEAHMAAAQAASAHALLGSAYVSMKSAGIYDFDEDIQEKYEKMAIDHFGKALADKAALAEVNTDEFRVLIEKGMDSKLFNNDMLSVIVKFVVKHHYNLKNSAKAKLYAEVANIYKDKGMRDAYILSKLSSLSASNQAEVRSLRLSDSAYKKELEQQLAEADGCETECDITQQILNLIIMEEFKKMRSDDEYEDNLYDDAKLKLLNSTIAKHNDKSASTTLKNERAELMAPALSISTADEAVANMPFKFNIKFKNLYEAKLTVRHFNGEYKYGEKRTNETNYKDTGKTILTRNYSISLTDEQKARQDEGLNVRSEITDSLTLPAGKYVVWIESGDNISATSLSLTTLAVTTIGTPDNKTIVHVLDNITGKPVENAEVIVTPRRDYRKPEVKDKTFKTNAKGIVVVIGTEFEEGFQVMARRYEKSLGDRDETGKTWAQTGRKAHHDSSRKIHVELFSDRSIYRPGQKVMLSGIVYSQVDDECQTLANRECTLTLYNTKNEDVETIDIKTNKLGSADAEFTLPVGMENGQWKAKFELKSNDIDGKFGKYDAPSHYVYFRVEEYKRPTFDVKVQKSDKESFALGDTINVPVKAEMLIGTPVQDAECSYKVEAAVGRFWSWWGLRWEETQRDTLTTDDNGMVNIPVVLTDEFSREDDSDNTIYCFRINAVVTDKAGETHESSRTIYISKKAFGLQIESSDIVDIAKTNTFEIVAMNAEQKEVAVSGKYTITQNGKTIISGSFKTGEELPLGKLRFGDYLITASAIDANGYEIKSVQKVSVFDSSVAQSRLTYVANGYDSDFFCIESSSFNENKDAGFFMMPQKAPGNKPTYIYYYIAADSTIVDNGIITSKEEMYHCKIKYEKRYGDGIVMYMFYVKDGHLYSNHQTFTYKKDDDRLQLEWKSFRDHTQPGSEEHWTLSIKDKDGKAVKDAELMATMYDASLDLLSPHSWGMYVSHSRSLPTVGYSSVAFSDGFRMSFTGKYNSYGYFQRTFNELIPFVHERYLTSHGMLYKSAARFSMHPYAESAPLPTMAMEKNGDAILEFADMDGDAAIPELAGKQDDIKPDEKDSKENEFTPRKNFNETALFMPHVMTDANGEAHIEFTMPESLTEWKFMGIAHTEDVRIGSITSRTIASKDFMVQPHMPRFLRMGDKAEISARVINRTDKPISGVATIRLLDAENPDVILYEKDATFAVAANATGNVTFDCPTDENDERSPLIIAAKRTGSLLCDIIGKSNSTVDGERNELPVISTRESVTECLPFYVNGNDPKDIDLSGLFNGNSATANDRTLSIEFNDNPAYDVFKALKAVAVPEHDNAPCLGASLYSNIVMKSLHERLSQTLESDSDDILKDFSSADADSNIDNAINKLDNLQNRDGSWSWFAGMEGSYFITIAVAEHLLKTYPYAVGTPHERYIHKALDKAIKFLEKEEVEQYENYMKYNKKAKSITPGESTLRYLNLTAKWSDITGSTRYSSSTSERMINAYLNGLESGLTDTTIYGRANGATTLRIYGRNKAAERFLTSLIEYSVEKPGMGRYFATDNAYYSWQDYRIPTQVAAMNALILDRQKKEISAAKNGKTDSIDELTTILNDMQVWLLRQKQTQLWQNPLNTIEVAELLLEVAPKVSTHKPVAPTLFLDGKQLEVAMTSNMGKSTPATYEEDGKTAIPVRTLNVTKHSEGISWGYARAAFTEEIGQLAAYSTGELKIERKFIINDDTMAPTDGISIPSSVKKLKVRYIITADRDMDFVSVKAQHPACFEPVNHLSGYQWMGGRACHAEYHDSYTNFFFSHFTKGTTTIDLEYYVTREGTYQMGMTSAECTYAPDFGCHSSGLRVKVEQ